MIKIVGRSEEVKRQRNVGSLTDFVLFPVTFKLYDKDSNKLLDSSVSYSKSLTSFSDYIWDAFAFTYNSCYVYKSVQNILVINVQKIKISV